jgi:hypothetical protein
MKPVRAKRLMDRLTKGLSWDGRSRKLDNAPDTFMPLYIGVAYETVLGKVYYLAHYGEQNGDLMADPEMHFLQLRNGEYYPAMYRNDFLGVTRQSLNIREDGKASITPREQADQAHFANSWLKNIRQQQKL